MKFQPDRADGVNTITHIGAAGIGVGALAFGHSLLVPWRGAVLRWAPARIDELAPAHFEQALALRPDLVIFGSGAHHRFASPALMRCLIERHIGIETMSTAAACRTYNVLAAEGRPVLAALLFDPADPPAA